MAARLGWERGAAALSGLLSAVADRRPGDFPAPAAFPVAGAHAAGGVLAADGMLPAVWGAPGG